jgi:hypothetical protein
MHSIPQFMADEPDNAGFPYEMQVSCRDRWSPQKVTQAIPGVQARSQGDFRLLIASTSSAIAVRAGNLQASIDETE